MIIEHRRVFIITLFLAFTLYACGEGGRDGTTRDRGSKTAPPGWDQVIRIVHTNIMIDKPAVTLFVGRDDKNYLAVAILKKNLRQGYEDRADGRNATARMLGKARSGQQTYTEMSDKNTMVRIKIMQLDSDLRKAVIWFKARLVDTNTNNRFLEVETTVVIDGDKFSRLLAP